MILSLLALGCISSATGAFQFTTYAHEQHQTSWVVPKNEYDIENLQMAYMKLEGRRTTLGLKRIPRGASEVDTSANDLFGWFLGFAYGLQYNAKKPGACYNAIAGSIYEYESILSMLQLIYVPTYWSDLVSAGQNQVSLFASVYANCNVQMAFNTIAGLFSAEGSSALVSRLLGGVITELPNYYKKWLLAPSLFV